MNDPRLNSIHLTPDRRELFRFARTASKCDGDQTCYFEQDNANGHAPRRTERTGIAGHRLLFDGQRTRLSAENRRQHVGAVQ